MHRFKLRNIKKVFPQNTYFSSWYENIRFDLPRFQALENWTK